MIRFLAALCFFVLEVEAVFSQQKIYVHVDKTVCVAGDTIWWKGYVFTRGAGTPGTNLYSDLFNDAGQKLQDAVSPVLNGQSIGQVAIPDSLPSGVYWLRFFTWHGPENTAPTAVLPLTVFHLEDKKITVLTNARADESFYKEISFCSDNLGKTVDGYDNWRFTLKAADICHCSLAVTRANETPARATVFTATDQGSVSPDTGFLRFSGVALKEEGQRPVTNKSLMLLLVKDSTIISTQVAHVGPNGRFDIDHLFFFGQAKLLYQLNTRGAAAKDVRLVLDRWTSPTFHKPEGWLRTKVVREGPEVNKYSIAKTDTGTKAKGKLLKEVKIKAWLNPRKELDKYYATGAFSEPTLYAFDLRNEKNYKDLGSYLRAHIAGFQGGYNKTDTPFLQFHPILFYVDEQARNWDELDNSINDIAYIKAFESDFIADSKFSLTSPGNKALKYPNQLKYPSFPRPMIISIYTRKGKDMRQAPGLNSIVISGYTPSARFQNNELKPPTRLWAPLIDANSFLIKLANRTSGEPLRITIAGMTGDGMEIFYETVITPN